MKDSDWFIPLCVMHYAKICATASGTYKNVRMRSHGLIFSAYCITNQRRFAFSIIPVLKSYLLREFMLLLFECKRIFFRFTILFCLFSLYNKKRVTYFINFMIDILYSILFIVCFCKAIININNSEFILNYALLGYETFNIYTHLYILCIYVIFKSHRPHGHKICIINTRATNQL